jgi:hypothetical protein
MSKLSDASLRDGQKIGWLMNLNQAQIVNSEKLIVNSRELKVIDT